MIKELPKYVNLGSNEGIHGKVPWYSQRILIQEENSMGLNFYGKSRNLSNPVMIQGGIDTSLTSFVVRNVFIHYVELFFRIKKNM